MMARVESRVTAVSYEDAVKVQNIYVVPGQKVTKGELLIEVVIPDLDLDMRQKENQLLQIDVGFKTINSEHEATLALIEAKYKLEIDEVSLEIQRLKTEINQNKNSREVIGRLTGAEAQEDSLQLLKLDQLEKSLENLKVKRKRELQAEDNKHVNEVRILMAKKVIATEEKQALERSREKLAFRAESDGTIGSISVEINELVSPFRKLLTIYELKPSLIKAYVSEALVGTLEVGDKVSVRASNRDITTPGIIEEIGTRVTNYPNQINPGTEPRYGQEVFIRIPRTHEFLDGEKVFVYPASP